MEQRNDSTTIVEEVQNRHVRLDENDHHLIVGAVASAATEVDSESMNETAPRKKRTRIKRKLEY